MNDPTQEQIGDVLTAIASRADAELMALDEAALAAQWYWRWEADKSVAWNTYQFSGMLELHKRQCRRWEEHHNGDCCIVERVRDKYLMPRVREFLAALATPIPHEANEEMSILKRMNAARSAAVTCSASRHAATIADHLIRRGTCGLLADDPANCGESIAATVAALWEARAEIERLRDAVRLADIDAALTTAEVNDLTTEVQRLRADAARLDWLADPGTHIGNVQLPTECVLAHPGAMRAAIDAAMRMGADAT